MLRTSIRKEPRHSFASIGWVEKYSFAARNQSNSFRAFWRWHAIPLANETTVDNNIMWSNRTGKTQEFDRMPGQG